MKIVSNSSIRYSMLAAIIVAACDNTSPQSEAVATTEPDLGEETQAQVHWGYEEENGPTKWGALEQEWQLCAAGRHQSPIDLVSPVENELPAIVVHTLSERAVEVLNQNDVLEELDNGHTVQVNAFLSDALQIEGKAYSLRQFHFHSPSEHTVDGEHLPMEIHFVNEAADGSLAVLGVLVSQGAENSAIESLWASLPQARGETSTTRLPESFAASLFTEAGAGFFHYSGSLTTPPCTEDVRWMIKKVPTELSAAQIQRFQAIYDHNNRPTNPLNDRELYLDSSPSIEFQGDAIEALDE